MANFILYRYKFEQLTEVELFSAEYDEKCTEDTHNKRFVDALTNAFNAKVNPALNFFSTKTEKDGTQSPEIYYNSIDCMDSGIFILRVRNNKVKKVIPLDSDEEKEVGHFPPCWVIIDTRPGSRLILVQKNDAFSNVDNVIDMIENWCGLTLNLSYLGWKFSTEKRQCTGSIWDIVKTRMRVEGERIKSLSIKFDGKKPNDNNEVDNMLQRILTTFAAPDGEIKLNSGKSNNPAFLNEEDTNIVETVNLLIKNNYRLKVAFDRSGTYEYGKGAEAIYGIEDNKIESFGLEFVMHQDGSTQYELVLWLDKIGPEDSAHEYTPHTAKRKKRNARK